MAFLLLDPLWQALDSNGKPLPGAKLYVYDAGTTDDAATYSDTALSSAHAQPVVADSAGRFANIYVAGGQSYKVSLTSSADVAIVTRDNLPPGRQVSGTLAIADGGTNATTAAGARTSLGAASSADLTTAQSTLTTIAGERTALVAGQFKALAGYDNVTNSLLSGIKRVPIQVVRNTTPASTTMTTTIPSDTTVPQNTEGTEIFTQSFTPLSASSTLLITCAINVNVVADGQFCLALFQSGSASAISASPDYVYSAGARSTTVVAQAQYAPGSTSALTISARAGTDASGTNTLNALYGASSVSFLEIIEIVNT